MTEKPTSGHSWLKKSKRNLYLEGHDEIEIIYMFAGCAGCPKNCKNNHVRLPKLCVHLSQLYKNSTSPSNSKPTYAQSWAHSLCKFCILSNLIS